MMPVDLSKLDRVLSFPLETDALGTIHCGSLKAGTLSRIERELQSRELDSVAFTRWLIQQIGRRIRLSETKENHDDRFNPEGRLLTDDEIARLSDDDTQNFARQFVARNQWLLQTYKSGQRAQTTDEKGVKNISRRPTQIEYPRDEAETHCHYLVRVLRRYFDKQSERWKTITRPFFASLVGSTFSNSTKEQLKKHVTLSDQLGRTLEYLDPNVRDPYIAGTLETPDFPFRPPQIPENPAHGTNQRLDDVLDHAEEIRPIILQSAELFRSMSDTALQMQADFTKSARHSLLASFIVICIATLSLFVTAWYSWWSYTRFSVQEAQYERTLSDNRVHIQTLLEQQDERYRQLLTNHASEFQALIERQQPQDLQSTELLLLNETIEIESDLQ